MNRRLLLKHSLATSIAAVMATAGITIPTNSMAAAWIEAEFNAKAVDKVFAELGATDVAQSDKITIKAPDIAENGAVVPITISTSLENVESISILADQNESPLTSTFNFGKGAVGFVATRIKMGKTANLVAVVKAGGKFYQAKKEVKVTIGGCGG
ncbi:MAG: thiosulfate oxidation carrier protein SoxY [Gammaproteobacteria bacterium]|nr:MAG: thiosulfate oxidation carrier protein SoxY [Gammaproteobacteria bacterium]